MRDPATSKSTVLRQPGTLEITSSAIPGLTDNDVLVRVIYVSLCGSDFKLFKGSHPKQPQKSIIIGHEWVGEVFKCGRSVTNLGAGDFVVSDCSLFCGHCPACNHDRNLCEKVEKLGITVDGSLREWVVLSSKYLYKLPENFPIKIASLVEPFAVAINAMSEINISNTNVMITGGGIIGIASALYLMSLGNSISIVEIDSDRRSLIESRLDSNISVYQSVPDEDFDIAIEASGQRVCVQELIDKISPKGTLILIGNISQPIDIHKVVDKSLNIMGSVGGTGSFNEAIELLNSESHIVKGLIAIISLSDVESVLRIGNSSFKNALKAVIRIGEEKNVSC
ncbi:MAG: zinc-dependent alcohol dehydrogenase [Thermoleophilia bacterium]